MASDEVNDHLRYLLEILLPHCEAVIAAVGGGEVCFTINGAGPTYPYHHGFSLAIDCVEGIAKMKAEIDVTWKTNEELDTL